jgi:hypothetical protein
MMFYKERNGEKGALGNILRRQTISVLKEVVDKL